MDIYIVTGFAGSGKTTFLNQYVPILSGKKAVIENELGEVRVLPELTGEEALIAELPSGCICCTLAIDLQNKLRELDEIYQVDKVFIEPSGVGKLSDVLRICRQTEAQYQVNISSIKKITLIDISVFEEYIEEFGDFFVDQIEYADVILLSYVDDLEKEDRDRIVQRIFGLNPEARVYKGDWRMLTEDEILHFIEQAEGEGKKPEEELVMTNLTSRGVRARRSGHQLGGHYGRD